MATTIKELPLSLKVIGGAIVGGILGYIVGVLIGDTSVFPEAIEWDAILLLLGVFLGGLLGYKD